MTMYHTDPPPTYPEFLKGAIPRKRAVATMCPGCGNVESMWSPTPNGVMVCPYCNVRLIVALSMPSPLRHLSA